MAEKGIRAIVAQGERAKKTLATRRAREREEQSKMLSSGLTILGGAAGGLIDGMYADTPDGVAELWGLPTNLAVGGAGTLLAVFGGRAVPGSDLFGPTCLGMLVVATYSETRKRVAEG